MHPEPVEASTQPSATVEFESPNPSPTQHGPHDHGRRSSSLSDLSDRLREASTNRPTSTDAFSDAINGLTERIQRMNVSPATSFRTRAAADRITEYERALTPVPKSGKEGPGFRVIPSNNPRKDGPRLDEFPNEVLTHILSHLPASSLSAMSLVSTRFYSLVTTPHAWRIAFARFFPGQNYDDQHGRTTLHGASDYEYSERSLFTRLSTLATWRGEYILRTRLLRSLARGRPTLKPGHVSSRSVNGGNNSAVVTYYSHLFSRITNIHGAFGSGKKGCRFIHGSDDSGVACLSDPGTGKVDNWGLSDPQALPQFADLFPGDQMYGLGSGDAGAPNVMDVSQPFGVIYGEGFPGGGAYYRSTDEMRGRFLESCLTTAAIEGIPNIPVRQEAITAVWIAKSTAVPIATSGLVGMLSGSTLGVVSAYSIGADNLASHRLAKGELTCRWVLSPGVPIIAIAVDDSFNAKRRAFGRIWAVALNALGECFYLSTVPQRLGQDKGPKLDTDSLHSLAWRTGRSAFWHLVEPTRRIARENPYDNGEVDGSYSPRSSSDDMNLSKDQLFAEAREIEKFLSFKPSHFRTVCEGWDMRRRLEVDFAGDDGHGLGEAIFVIDCGLEEGSQAGIRRFTRWRSENLFDERPASMTPPVRSTTSTIASLFGPHRSILPQDEVSVSSGLSSPSVESNPYLVEEWRTSAFIAKGFANAQIATTTIDMSTYAVLTTTEDPLLNSGSPTNQDGSGIVPGQRARFLAVGTKLGAIFIWNMRGPQAANDVIVNNVHSIRVIQTESPQISCLALTALYLVHGGNDGLVQAWDPLASTAQPLRTLHSRFSTRARRRLIQAEASAHGVGMNLYAAGAICLDSDPTVLRGMISLGTHLRYFSFSSSAAETHASKKRRLRRGSERGTNSSQRFVSTGRGALMDYIATEHMELKQDEEQQARKDAWLRGRFGVGLGGLSDLEAIQYAEMISREAFEKEEERRMSDTSQHGTGDSSSNPSQSLTESGTITPDGSDKGQVLSPIYRDDDKLDRDMEEAIRLSLLDGLDDNDRCPNASGSTPEIPITYKPRRHKSSMSPTSNASASHTFMSSDEDGVDDLELALRLSLAEERSRHEVRTEWEEYPALKSPEPTGKGKGKAI